MIDEVGAYPLGAEELLELADQARQIGRGRAAAVKLAAPAVPKWRASIVGPLLERRCFLCGAGYFGAWIAHLELGRCK